MGFSGRFLTCGLVLAVVLCGCQTIERVDPRKRAAEQHSEKIRKLQLEVMRFADEYTGRSREAVTRLQEGLENPDKRLVAQNWKVQQASAAYTIASGPNPVSNALDMVVLATLSRMVIDDTWVGGDIGARALEVQATYRSLEAEAWRLVKGVLNEEQVAALHQTITQWRAKNPTVRAVSYIHFRDFAQAVGPSSPSSTGAGSLLSFVGIDPLSNLDPAVQEIAQTRQLAERAIYYMQRTPDLLDMQVERLSYQFADMPETRSLLASFDRVSLIGSASDRLVDKLPDLLDQQREAVIAQLTQTINSQSATLGTLAGQLRGALQAGTDTATAVNGALQSFERISNLFAKKPQPASATPQPPGKPFDISDYTAMLQQAASTARELDTLAQRSDALLPVLRSATQDAALRAQGVLNHLFLLLVLLVLVIAAAWLLAALAYRRITMRFTGS
jgi:predicted component of type VI protein secretion system